MKTCIACALSSLLLCCIMYTMWCRADATYLAALASQEKYYRARLAEEQDRRYRLQRVKEIVDDAKRKKQ